MTDTKTTTLPPANLGDLKIAVIGLGYVGLPLAAELGRLYPVLGYDVNNKRIEDLEQGVDNTREVDAAQLASAQSLKFSSDPSDLAGANFYIVTVPTPIDDHKRPVLKPLILASEAIAKVLTKGDIVVYESTVYPGATEEDCVPVLERGSGLQVNRDFFVGYSPERINPGDKTRRLTSIQKVVSGSTPEALEIIDGLYSSIIHAGTHRAPTIKVAEAAKVIENTQRDLNIALINELAMIFSRLKIDTHDVLEAAGTKWNFLKFKPGLVGGHCIGVDPYYLTHKAQAIGYHPDVILAGRRINDGMGRFVAGEMVKAMLNRSIQIKGARVLVLGLAFKENCPDLRNTRVIDVIQELEGYNVSIDVYDPCVSPDEAEAMYGIRPVPEPMTAGYDGILLAVGHEEFCADGFSVRQYGAEQHLVYDIKNVLTDSQVDVRL